MLLRIFTRTSSRNTFIMRMNDQKCRHYKLYSSEQTQLNLNKKTIISYVQFFMNSVKFYESNRFRFVYIFHNSDNLHKINIHFTERHNTLWWKAASLSYQFFFAPNLHNLGCRNACDNAKTWPFYFSLLVWRLTMSPKHCQRTYITGMDRFRVRSYQFRIHITNVHINIFHKKKIINRMARGLAPI